MRTDRSSYDPMSLAVDARAIIDRARTLAVEYAAGGAFFGLILALLVFGNARNLDNMIPSPGVVTLLMMAICGTIGARAGRWCAIRARLDAHRAEWAIEIERRLAELDGRVRNEV